MKNFIKSNWFKVSFLCALIIIIVLGIYYLTFISKNNNGTIISQQNCSKKAEEFYLKNKDSNIAWLSGSDYINHFNNKMGKCFVLIKGGNLNIEYHSALYDPYENKELGSVHTLMDTNVGCGLQIGDTYKECGNFLKEKSNFSAITEFNNLTKVYMEN